MEEMIMHPISWTITAILCIVGLWIVVKVWKKFFPNGF